MKDKTMEEIR